MSFSSIFKNKKIVLGVTGSIAAYKAIHLASLLTHEGAHVFTVLTENASKFITPLTFSTITGEPCIKSLFDSPEAEIRHLGLVEEAEAFIVAPATANLISKIAYGIADDALTTSLLAAQCPIIVAPAMNSRMYLNPLIQENLRKLHSLGFYILGPEKGRLACREKGVGKMVEPEKILNFLQELFTTRFNLKGKKILVTAGPTREYLDDIRFISNRSSGKMGYSLAQEAAQMGAEVTLISGPVNLPSPAYVKLIKVETASEMLNSCKKYFPEHDVLIMAAAVSDYRPKVRKKGKIKKGQKEKEVSLEETEDILGELSKIKKEDQLIVGFAAETEDLIKSAKEKLKRKKLDFIVANPIEEGVGFESELNKGYFIFSDGKVEEVKLLPKRIFARKILQKVTELF